MVEDGSSTLVRKRMHGSRVVVRHAPTVDVPCTPVPRSQRSWRRSDTCQRSPTGSGRHAATGSTAALRGKEQQASSGRDVRSLLPALRACDSAVKSGSLGRARLPTLEERLMPLYVPEARDRRVEVDATVQPGIPVRTQDVDRVRAAAWTRAGRLGRSRIDFKRTALGPDVQGRLVEARPLVGRNCGTLAPYDSPGCAGGGANERRSQRPVGPWRAPPCSRVALLRLDPGGFDDPGSAFALAQHKPREVGLRHAHRFATVFHERGAHAGI
jgi:hypothetical protein